MSDSESDIEIRSALPKMKIQNEKKPITPPEDIKTKKITTKMMVVNALIELKTRKGVSLYAIKKHLTDKYEVNTSKVNYLIKKTIKAGVEDGTFVQMKGIGAAGSFKLANIKEKPKAKKKSAKPKEKKEKTKEKPTSPEKKKKILEKKTVSKIDDSKTKEAKKPKTEKKKTDKTDMKKEDKVKKVKKTQEKEGKQETDERKKKKVKTAKGIAKGMQTPSKKRSAMMKRKSIGSIIKPPKMKPKKA